MKRLYIYFFFLFFPYLSFAQQIDEQQSKWFDLFFGEALKCRLKGDFDRASNFYVNCFKINNKSATVAFELSRISNAKKDLDGANKFIDIALGCDSFSNIHYLRYAIDLKLSLNRFSECINLYERLNTLEPNNFENYLMLSQIYTSLENYDKAIKNLDLACKANSDVSDLVLLDKANIYLKQGKRSKALNLLENLYKKGPNNSKYLYFLSEYYLSIGDTAQGISFLNKAVILPGGEIYLFALSDLYFAKKDTANFELYSNKAFNSALISSETKYYKILDYVSFLDENFLTTNIESCISQYPDNVDFYCLLALYYTIYSNESKAIEVYERLYNVSDMSWKSWRDFLSILISTDNYEKLLFYSKEAVNQFPDSPLFLLFYGQSLQMQEYYVESLRPLLHAYNVLLNDTSADSNVKISVLNTLAGSYYYVDSISNAFSYFEEVLKIDNYNIMALNNYSYYLSLLGQDLDKAESMSRKTVDLYPNNSTYLDTYAWVLYKLGRYNEALFIIERAVDNLLDDSWEVLDHYGDILLMTGDKAKALEMWKKAYNLNNSKTQILEKIESL